MPEGGSEFSDEELTCLRCGALATRTYEGCTERLSSIDVCESCHTALGEWLRGGR